MFRNLKVLLIALVVVAAAGSAYAFAAANTVADSAAGYKANVVPGYTVSAIVYDLDATDPTLVISVATAFAAGITVSPSNLGAEFITVTALKLAACDALALTQILNCSGTLTGTSESRI